MSVNTKMFCLLKLCRICLRSGLTFENLNNEDEDGILLNDKLKICVPKIVSFVKMLNVYTYLLML